MNIVVNPVPSSSHEQAVVTVNMPSIIPLSRPLHISEDVGNTVLYISSQEAFVSSVYPESSRKDSTMLPRAPLVHIVVEQNVPQVQTNNQKSETFTGQFCNACC